MSKYNGRIAVKIWKRLSKVTKRLDEDKKKKTEYVRRILNRHAGQTENINSMSQYNMEDRNSSNAICQFLWKTAFIVLKVCLLAVSSYLAYIGIRYSYYSSKDYNQAIYLVEDTIWIHILVFAGICLFAGLALVIWRCVLMHDKGKKNIGMNGENLCKLVLCLSCILLMVVEYFFIREHPYYPSGDQLNTTAGAAYARQGNYLMFSKGGYIGLYENQKGLLFFYEILFTLFGDYCYDIAAKFHLILSIITLLSGYAFLKIIMKKSFYRIIYCVMMVFCIPCIIYLPYIYGDLPAICFSMVLFWALAAYEQRSQKRYLVCGAVMSAFALLMRMHIWIVLIAVVIGLILSAFQKKNIRPIIAGLCIILTAVGAVKGVDKLYEYRSGYESGVGIPYILWICMGLQETDGNPGVYNRFQQTVFEQCNFDQDIAEQVGKEYIAERLKELKANPAYSRYFFTTKLKMQWTEPLFEGLYATNSFKDEREISDLIEDLYYGDFHDTIWNFANYYQSVVYLGFFSFLSIHVVKYRKAMSGSSEWIPLIAVFGGLLFSIIWENQCRYVLSYFVYLVLYASIGIGFFAEGLFDFAAALFVDKNEC